MLALSEPYSNLGGLPVILCRLLSNAIRPRPIIVVEAGSGTQLRFGDVCPVPAQFRVISEFLPGDCVMVTSDTQKSAERDVYIHNPATDLFDQQPLDRANLPALKVENGRYLRRGRSQ